MIPLMRLTVILISLAFFWPTQGSYGQSNLRRKPHSAEDGQVREKKGSDKETHEAESSIKHHRQQSYQRKSSEQVHTHSHESEVKTDPPLDIFESEGAKAADHIPKPLPTDELGSAEATKKPKKTVDAARKKSDLERAWIQFNRKQYGAAAELFERVVNSQPRRALNARMGLAYSRLKQGRRNETTDHLQYLVNKNYRLKETLPLLLDLLIASRKYKAAEGYFHLLPDPDREKWHRRVLAASLGTEYSALKNKENSINESEWVGFIANHQQALKRCIRPDIFFNASTQLKTQLYRQRAIAVQRALLSCEMEPELRIGILEQLSNLKNPVAALELIQREKYWFQEAAPQYLPRINRLELSMLKRRLLTTELGPVEQRSVAEAILKIDPKDRDARSLVAWSDLEQKRYQESETRFERLWRENPANRDYALGLGYSRLNSGRYAEALEPFENGLVSDDSRTLKLKSLVYRARAQKAYEKQNWSTAAENLEAALIIDPEDLELKSLLAWTRYRQNRIDEAVELMESVYEQQPDAATASDLMDLYDSGPDKSRTRRFAIKMAESQNQDKRKKAARYLFSNRAPITAAQTGVSNGVCYAGADSLRLETFVYHKNKTGDDGTAELAETSFPITLKYPTRLGNQWSFSVTPRHLSSGDAPDTPYAGSFYRFLNGSPQTNDLEDSIWVWQPDIGFEKEGPIHFAVHLGSSPFGGAVGPTPTMSVRLSTESWFLDLHRCTVRDSILSFIGLDDPYSSDEWGRVLRNGISASITRPIFTNYWVNVAGGYDYYTGENLWDNSSVQFNTAAGRTFDYDGDEISLGVFFTAHHYRRNSDFYTYGHGGYYSPEIMTIIGPFFRYRSALCRPYWFDIQVSAGWLHQNLDSSPVYPKFSGDVSGFTPSAVIDANAEYSGGTDNKLGVSAKIQGMKLLTDHLAVGGFAGVDNNADFTRWQVGLGLQFFLEKQNAFWQRRDFFNDYGECSNR